METRQREKKNRRKKIVMLEQRRDGRLWKEGSWLVWLAARDKVRTRLDCVGCCAYMMIAIPRVELFASIKEVIAGFPTTADLRKQLLNHLYDQVLKILGNEPKAIVFRACRFIGEEGGTELILGLDKASQEIRSLIGKGHSEYVKFVEEWCKRVEDVNMVSLYFII